MIYVVVFCFSWASVGAFCTNISQLICVIRTELGVCAAEWSWCEGSPCFRCVCLALLAYFCLSVKDHLKTVLRESCTVTALHFTLITCSSCYSVVKLLLCQFWCLVTRLSVWVKPFSFSYCLQVLLTAHSIEVKCKILFNNNISVLFLRRVTSAVMLPWAVSNAQ